MWEQYHVIWENLTLGAVTNPMLMADPALEYRRISYLWRNFVPGDLPP
jgi:hypothetical protein